MMQSNESQSTSSQSSPLKQYPSMQRIPPEQDSSVQQTAPKQYPLRRRGSGIPARWAAAVAALAAGVIYNALPGNLTIGPNWLLLLIEAFLLVPLLLSWLGHQRRPHITTRVFVIALLVVLTAALFGAVVHLILTLPKRHGGSLLDTVGLLWVFNIFVFALWYWEIDGGGTEKRHENHYQAADFMFPQQADGNTGSWKPHFLDYLFLSFTTATAFSPTDTYPLTQLAKSLVIIESVISLLIVVLLAARAVSMIG